MSDINKRDLFKNGFKMEDFFTANPHDIDRKVKCSLLTPGQAKDLANFLLKEALETSLKTYFNPNNGEMLSSTVKDFDDTHTARLVCIEKLEDKE